jgi:hypothetical protein
MKTTSVFLLLCATLLLAACRGRESMASRSAQAYQKAMQTGTPLGGDGHGGHAPATPDHAAMGHAATGQPADHAAMAHAATGQPADHAAMGHGAAEQPADHAAMGHGMPDQAGMRPGTEPASQQHGEHTGTQQPGHAGHTTAQQTPMQQQPAQMDHAAMGHAAAPPAASAGQRTFPISEPPASSREMGQLRPSSTLSSDPQDAPAPSAVGEARKAAAAAAGGHAGHEQTQPPPQDQPPAHDHGSGR